MNNHEKFYGRPEYYDIAFDFRDVPEECDFIEAVYSGINGRKLSSIIELCAGPAYHTIEFGLRDKEAAALDLSPEMVEYGRLKAEKAGAQISYFPGNMTDFRVEHKYDMAILLMDSVSYLLDNEEVYKNLKCVSEALEENGLYLIEISHPRDFLGKEKAPNPKWKMKRELKEVEIQWGDEDDPFDPITQISQTLVKIKYSDGLNRGEIEDRAAQRCFTVNEFKALVDASGRFEIVDFYGSMKKNVPFDNSKEAWRMVPILKKI